MATPPHGARGPLRPPEAAHGRAAAAAGRARRPPSTCRAPPAPARPKPHDDVWAKGAAPRPQPAPRPAQHTAHVRCTDLHVVAALVRHAPREQLVHDDAEAAAAARAQPRAVSYSGPSRHTRWQPPATPIANANTTSVLQCLHRSAPPHLYTSPGRLLRCWLSTSGASHRGLLSRASICVRSSGSPPGPAAIAVTHGQPGSAHTLAVRRSTPQKLPAPSVNHPGQAWRASDSNSPPQCPCMCDPRTQQAGEAEILEVRKRRGRGTDGGGSHELAHGSA
jgi:hypothetical protein